MSISQLDVLMAFLESVKDISDNFIEVSKNELDETSFIYKGAGGYIYGAGMSLALETDSDRWSSDTILLLGEDDEEIAILFIEYTDDEDEYEDECDRPFFIKRVLTNAYLIDQYEFDNTEEYFHDNRSAKAMNKYK